MSDSPAAILHNTSAVEVGTAANPLRVDPTGSTAQPVSLSQTTANSTLNSSTANLAAGASFEGSSEALSGIAGIQVVVKADKPLQLEIYQSTDGTNWDVLNEWMVLPEDGINARTIQAVGKYYKTKATNVGGTVTTYMRLQTNLHNDALPIPRAPSARGCLRTSKQTASFTPAPQNYVDRDSDPELLVDVGNALCIRGAVLTDELSYRDDFTAGQLYTDISGTAYFTNGSDVVTGNGTAFQSDLRVGEYVKISSHDDTVYAQISSIESDTYLTIRIPYIGASTSGTLRSSAWKYSSANGSSFSQASSMGNMITGTTSGAYAAMEREGDYGPFLITVKAAVSQRIANQEISFGFIDDPTNINNQALVVFTGTDNTQVTLRTSFSNTDIETTTATIPGGAVSSTQLYYQLEVLDNRISLWIGDVKVIEHRLHLPGPYAEMMLRLVAQNTGTAASTTTLAVDVVYFNNFDRVEVKTSPKGDFLSTKEIRSNSSVCTNVSASASSVQLLVSNANRMGAMIYNDSTAVMYLKLGTTASITSYTVQLNRYDYYEVPSGYTGRIDGIWTAATGSARVTEVS
jgi:hypothetical protein